MLGDEFECTKSCMLHCDEVVLFCSRRGPCNIEGLHHGGVIPFKESIVCDNERKCNMGFTTLIDFVSQ